MFLKKNETSNKNYNNLKNLQMNKYQMKFNIQSELLLVLFGLVGSFDSDLKI